ncbi:MAG TPA: hypothetical protein VFS56_00850 [Gemmatimonadaceae bacterium]|nr:hypothetical protein [Gemmatimonadaceae bacterium]
MNRIMYAATLTVLLVGCETSTDPIEGIGGNGPGGGAVTQAQASGNWSFTLRRTTTLSCTGGSLPDNQVMLAHLDVTNTGTLSTGTSTWQASPPGVVRPLSGTLSFSTGLTNLTLFPSVTNTSAAMELTGTLTAAGTFSGTLRDPAPGFTPVFSGNGCEYTATGVKTA